MAQAYREDARPKQRAVVELARSPLRVSGLAFGILFFAPLSVGIITATESEASIACTRAADGSGTCTRTVKFLTRTERDTFDVRKLRSARTKRTGSSRGGVVFRTWLDVDGAEVPLGPGSRDALQVRIGDSIDRFAKTESIAALDERYACDALFPAILGCMAAFAAIGLVIGALLTPRRRLRLDGEGDLATLEQRRFVRWRTVWTMALSNVARVHVEDAELFLDTKHGGAIPLGRSNDSAIAELDAFLGAR